MLVCFNGGCILDNEYCMVGFEFYGILCWDVLLVIVNVIYIDVE